MPTKDSKIIHKMYFISYALEMQYPGQPTIVKFKSMITGLHPLHWQALMRRDEQNELRMNTSKSKVIHTLIYWKELTEKEYRIYKNYETEKGRG